MYVFCIYLRTNSDLCHLQHKLVGFYNRDEKCLQRGTDWVFINKIRIECLGEINVCCSFFGSGEALYKFEEMETYRF